MKKLFKQIMLICLAMIFVVAFSACGKDNDANTNSSSSSSQNEIVDDNNAEGITADTTAHNFELNSSSNGTFSFKCTDEDCDKTVSFTLSCESGTQNAYSLSGTTLTFNVTEESEYKISGEFYGNIVINVGEEVEFKLSLAGFSITSYTECPIAIESGDKVTLTAKKDTTNYVYDLREVASEDDYAGAIHSNCDFDVQGNGTLFVKSQNNNGIHTKDDLKIKNLTLEVDCQDNALKGNDSVTIESGTLTLIARSGDGIKTSNSDISEKTSKQRGTIQISGGTLLIYAACDGIDASYNAVIDGENADIEIYTDKYSKFSTTVTTTEEDILYVRYQNTNYKYSFKFYNSETDYVWKNSASYETASSGRGGSYYYYPITKPQGYSKVKLFIYSSSQSQGQETDCLGSTDYLTINSNYDTIALQTSYSGSTTYGWTNRSQTGGMGGMGGMGGGMQDGNTDKGEYSTKGIKADNEIVISAGKIQIKSYDDAIHANNDNTLENEQSPLGNVTISGGTLLLESNDDGVHADGALQISGGSVNVSKSYEGLEGNTVNISNGDVSIISSDDGINGTATSGQSIVISGGTLYVYAGGDGVDSNSRTSYNGILFSGGKSVIIATSSDNSSIDTENGYAYTGGYVIGIGRSGGMNNEESTKCSSFSSKGSSKTLSLTQNGYLVVSNVATVKMPTSINAFVVVLSNGSKTISSASSSSATFDDNGVCWNN